MSVKQPPVDKYIVKCEQEILTAIFTSPVVVEECATALDPLDFLDSNNKQIYAAICQLHISHLKQVNKNTVIDYITNNPQYQFANWQAYIDELANGFSYGEDLKANIELVKNASIKRQLDAFAGEIVETKIDFAKYENQIFELSKKFMDIIESKRTSKIADMDLVAHEYYEKVNALRQRTSELTGTPSGFGTIDRVTNGFQPSDLIILAARPGVGKTAISLNFIKNAAEEILRAGKADKEKVVIFSLEMGKEQLFQRLVAMKSLVSSSALRSGKLGDLEWATVQNSIEDLKQLPILIDDSSDTSIIDIQSKLKQLSNQYGKGNIKLVVVDYIQLMKGPRVKGVQANRQQEVATISRMLKLLARQINAPIIALAQLSREVEKRNEGAKPILSDLRESGALEQDADIVCFLSQQKAIGEDEKETNVVAQGPKDNSATRIINFDIAKHRNGEVRTIQLSLNPSYGLFYEMATTNPNKGDK